jgi:hypothetical protein
MEPRPDTVEADDGLTGNSSGRGGQNPQYPAVEWAKVVKCYKLGGSEWTDFPTDGVFAVYCKANPCDQTGVYVDTATDIYIMFGPTLTEPAGAPLPDSKPGVVYCQAGHIIPYHPISEISAEIDGVIVTLTGIEIGWLYRLPWVCLGDAGEGYYGTDWGMPDTYLLTAPTESSDTLSVDFNSRQMAVEPCGRVVKAYKSSGMGASGIVAAWFDAEDLNHGLTGYIPIHFHTY